MESKIQPIFSTPIYQSSLQRDFTDEELNFFKTNKKMTKTNLNGLTTSEDTYILNHAAMSNLKKNIYEFLLDYYEKIICTDDKVSPYITQSWLNWQEHNQGHHDHSHPNSFISGVLYINCFEDKDSIKFTKEGYEFFKFFNLKSFNIFNSSTWTMPVKSGLIILFPSYLMHNVDKNKFQHTRTSLAFNSYIRGTIGSYKHNYELSLI
tara:strand:+ start:862 stop:1482 length:621 start_codon:yes stop_codon:yes gene_type:complete